MLKPKKSYFNHLLALSSIGIVHSVYRIGVGRQSKAGRENIEKIKKNCDFEYPFLYTVKYTDRKFYVHTYTILSFLQNFTQILNKLTSNAPKSVLKKHAKLPT